LVAWQGHQVERPQVWATADDLAASEGSLPIAAVWLSAIWAVLDVPNIKNLQVWQLPASRKDVPPNTQWQGTAAEVQVLQLAACCQGCEGCCWWVCYSGLI
jgi:hypothetical protein